MLQKVGTDSIRNVYPDFWIEYVYRIISVFKNEWDYVLIPDTRFPNEIDYYSKVNFPHRVVRIERTNYNSGLTEEQLKHPSETSLDDYNFDIIIYNNKSIERFNESVISFMDSELLKNEENNEQT